MRDHVTDRFEEYLAGALEAHHLENFEQHIRECRSCEQALEDCQEARSYLKWLAPFEAAPEPGANFYARVQASVAAKNESGVLGGFFTALHAPGMSYALLFVFFGLLLAAWNMTLKTEWTEAGILGIPPARFSTTISSEADRMRSRDMVMVSLVETLESQ